MLSGYTAYFEERHVTKAYPVPTLVEDRGRERMLDVVGRRLVAHRNVHERRVDHGVGEVRLQIGARQVRVDLRASTRSRPYERRFC